MPHYITNPGAQVDPPRELHTSDGDTVALWQFRDDLTDASPAGLDLTETGTVPYVEYGITPVSGYSNAECVGGVAATISGTNHGHLTPADPTLEITGAMTIMCLVYVTGHSGSSSICSIGGAAETEVDNILYDFRLNSSRQLFYLSEHGTGTNQSYTATGGAVTQDQWVHVAIVRQSGGDVEMFIDGSSTGSSAGLTAPTGGTNGDFYIGRSVSGSNGFDGNMASLIILDTALSGAAVLAEANRLLADW